MSSSEPLIRPGLSTSIKKNLPKIKAELRAKVPNLTTRDVQLRSQPYQEIIRYEMCDEGYISSLKLFDGMIENDGKSFKMKLVSELSDEVRDILTKLSEELKAVEDTFDQFDRQAKILLNLALYLTVFYQLFPWTTRKLFEMALNAASKCDSDDKFIETLVQYHYANFLFQYESFNDASIKIQAALDVARSKNEKWSMFRNDESTSLMKSVVLLYFKIFLQKARQMTTTGGDKQEAQQIAANVIGDICRFLDDPSTMSRCFYEYGDFLQTNKLFLKAIDAYTRGKSEANKSKDIMMQCKGQFNIANCYKELKNFIKAEKYVKALYELANENQQDFWMAEALLLLAELHSKSNENSHKAIQYAEQALALFQLSPPFSNQQQKLDQARIIVAKFKADQMYPAYLQSIYQCEMGSEAHFLNLLNWQISRKNF